MLNQIIAFRSSSHVCAFENEQLATLKQQHCMTDVKNCHSDNNDIIKQQDREQQQGKYMQQ